ALAMNRLKFRAWSNVALGGMASSWRALTTSSSAGPLCASTSRTAPSSFCGSSTRMPWMPIASAIAAKLGFLSSVPVSRKPLAFGELVEILARLFVVGDGGIEILAVGFLLELGQQGGDRRGDIAHHAQREMAAIAEAFGPDVDLRDLGSFGIELPVGKVGAQQ